MPNLDPERKIDKKRSKKKNKGIPAYITKGIPANITKGIPAYIT